MSDDLQATIDALNARTAAYDVQVIELRQQVSQLQQQLEEERESSRRSLIDVEERLTALNVALNDRWQAQNAYVIALEKQAVGEVRAALIEFRDAETRVQFEALRMKLASTVQ